MDQNPPVTRPGPSVTSLALAALALSAFATGTAEFVAIGLLPELSGDLDVGLGLTGLVVSVYALTVVVGGPLLTAAGTRVRRRTVLLALMGVFAAGNVVAACAPDLPVLLVGRVLAALGQGAFFGVGSVVAAELVPAHRRARAVAVVFSGITVANVLGAPLGTLVGQQWGWRAAFWGVALAGAAGFVAIAAFVPDRARTPTGLRAELAAFRSTAVWSTLAVGALAMCGIFTMFSYAAVLVTDTMTLPAGAVTVVLVLFGLGLTAGNLLGGSLADRNRLLTMVAAPAVLTVALLALAVVAAEPVAAIALLVVVGASGFAVIPAYLGRLMDLAAAPTLAAAAAGSAGNLGVSLGATLGAAALDTGWGAFPPAWAGAVPAAAAALLATSILIRARRDAHRGSTVGVAPSRVSEAR